MRHTAILLLCLAVVGWNGLRALAISQSASYSVGTLIPDNDVNGVVNTQTFSSAIDSITALEVSLTISGGYKGDLYAYVTHGSGFSVLLNRPGVTGSDPFGDPTSGFTQTFALSSFNGLDPNGSWTFFIADLSAVGIAQFSNWGLNVTGNTAGGSGPPVLPPSTSVPESGGTGALLALAASLMFLAERLVQPMRANISSVRRQ